MSSTASGSVGARRVRDDEPARVSNGVVVRLSHYLKGCSDEACCSWPAGPVAALATEDGARRA